MALGWEVNDGSPSAVSCYGRWSRAWLRISRVGDEASSRALPVCTILQSFVEKIVVERGTFWVLAKVKAQSEGFGLHPFGAN
jgi:hypothetical protein